MSRAGDLRVRLSSSRHAVPTVVSGRDLDVLARQIGQFVALAKTLAARLRGPTIAGRAASPGLEERLGHLGWAVLAGQAALTQLALLQHQQRGGAGRLSRFVLWRVHW